MKKKVVLETDWILDFFKIEIEEESKILTSWLSSTFPLDEAQKKILGKLRHDYKREGDSWNEEELKVRFLAHLLWVADMEAPKKAKTFLERNMSAEYQDHHISVDVDLMLASVKGLNTPQSPYFFLQELKKGKKASNDPEAQMLAAMLAAQIENQDSKPVFGGYVVGRFWFFAVLEGKKYSLSSAFDITQEADIQQVIFCLRKIKELVLD